MAKGKLIVIEGVDGCGKATQTQKLFERLKSCSFKIRKVDFPNYESESSSLVKMYLRGDFGQDAKSVNPYIASTFYAADRYATFKKEYESFYADGGIVIADRYTTANMVHQAGKIYDEKERNNFLDWLESYEYGLYQLPIPDYVFFLDIPIEFSEVLMKERNNKFTGEAKKDIHERDSAHLKESYYSAISVAEKYNWIKISCVAENQLRSIEDIHEEVYNKLIKEMSNEKRSNY